MPPLNRIRPRRLGPPNRPPGPGRPARRGRPPARAAQPSRRRPERSQPHEPGLVVGHVLDAGAEHLTAVAFGRHAIAERRPPTVVLGHGLDRLGGRAAGEHLRPRQPRADEPGALGGRLWMRHDRLDLGELERGPGDQAMANRVDDLAEDRDVLGLHRQGVERGVDRPLERVLDRDQRALDGAEVNRHHGVVDRRVGDRVQLAPGRRREQRLLGPGALRAEIGDAHPLGVRHLAGRRERHLAGRGGLH